MHGEGRGCAPSATEGGGLPLHPAVILRFPKPAARPQHSHYLNSGHRSWSRRAPSSAPHCSTQQAQHRGQRAGVARAAGQAGGRSCIKGRGRHTAADQHPGQRAAAAERCDARALPRTAPHLRLRLRSAASFFSCISTAMCERPISNSLSMSYRGVSAGRQEVTSRAGCKQAHCRCVWAGRVQREHVVQRCLQSGKEHGQEAGTARFPGGGGGLLPQGCH